MIEPKMGYWCTECGNTYTNESVNMCQYEECIEYVCEECDGSYCEDCSTIIEREDMGEEE